MNKAIIFFGLLILFSITSCKKDFLDRSPYNAVTTSTFYVNSTQALEGLTAIYDVLQRENWDSPILNSEMMSDDCTGGGGATETSGAEYDTYYTVITDDNNDIWQNDFLGINRVHQFLAGVDKVIWTDAEKKQNLGTQYKAEARFLRAYFYFEAAKVFGHIPLITSVIAPTDVPKYKQAPAADVYNLIATDLKYAIDSLAGISVPYSSAWAKANGGRVTKWAAEALLARVYLFYTGYYGTSSIGNIVTKAVAQAYIDDVIANSGHDLVKNYADLWLASKLEGTWAGKDNIETVFSIKYSTTGNGNFNINDGSRWEVMIAPRLGGKRGAPYYPYAKGWGYGNVNKSLYNAFDTADLRRDASIINYNKEFGVGVYDRGDISQYTGYSWKKYCPLGSKSGDGNEVDSITSSGGSFMIDNYFDEYVVRYSDVLLMSAELHVDDNNALATQYYNEVRDRGFNYDGKHLKTSVTKGDILNERKLEFALEGLRYWDLLRNGVSSALDTIVNNATDYPLIPASDFISAGFEGFCKIPETQITLSNGALVQNAYWTTDLSKTPTSNYLRGSQDQ